MPELQSTLDDTGQKLLRYFASKYLKKAKGGHILVRDQIIKGNDLTDDEYDNYMARFENAQAIEISKSSGRYAEVIKVTSNAVSVLHDLDNRPPPDYWKKTVTWFRNKWWSVPVSLFFVVAGLVGGCISLYREIAGLFAK